MSRDIITTAALLLIAVSGCGKRPAANVAAAPAPPAILVASPQPGVIQRVIEQPGVICADEETHLIARIPGYVSRVRADIGQRVAGPKRDGKGIETESGQILAEIAVPELVEEGKQKDAQVKQAEAEVEQSRKAVTAAEAKVASATAAVKEADAALDKAQALYDRWQSEANRVSSLVGSGIIDAQTRDETLNQFKAAEAGRNEARARIESAKADVRKAEADRGKADADVKAVAAKVDVCSADARRVAALLSYATIRAPFDGVVTSRRVNTGDLLSASTARPGVFTIARLDPVRVVVNFPEADAGLIDQQMPVELTIQAVQKQKMNAAIARTAWSLESGSRSLRAEIDLPNPEGRLRPGMYVYVHVRIAHKAEWTIPAAAIVKQGDAIMGYLAVDGKAQKVALQIGRSDGQRAEILGYKRETSATAWTPLTGAERFAHPAASMTAGQQVPSTP